MELLVIILSQLTGFGKDEGSDGGGGGVGHFLAEKNNFINQFLVKLGWGWTLTLGKTEFSLIYLSLLIFCNF